MNVAYKYRLYPTANQTQLLKQIAGSTRWLWNQMLAATTAQYAVDKRFIWAYDLNKLIPVLKTQHEWLKQAPSQSLQDVGFRIDRALKRATGKNRDQGFPKFKSKHRSKDGFTVPQTNGHIKVSDTHITIPKLGQVKWRYHRTVSGTVKSISVTRNVNHWYVSVCCEIPNVVPITDVDKTRTVGIDLGVSSFATLSDGTKIQSPNFLKKQLRKLKYQQRFLKNKVKGSANRQKQNTRISRIHRHIRNQRADWLHKLSYELVEKYDVICVEDLKIRELLQKKQLSRCIADQGWGIFVSQLAYKTRLRAKHLTKIDTYLPSTKTCSCCGATRKMKLSDRVYVCENPHCADYLKTKDRDHNAATNIHIWGVMATPNINLYTPGTGGIKACGDTSTDQSNHDQVSAKQEAACSLEPR